MLLIQGACYHEEGSQGLGFRVVLHPLGIERGTRGMPPRSNQALAQIQGMTAGEAQEVIDDLEPGPVLQGWYPHNWQTPEP